MLQIRRSLRDLTQTPRIIYPLVALSLLCILTTQCIQSIPRETILQQVGITRQSGGLYSISRTAPPSINLVIAATSKEDYSWVKELRIPNLKVLPYIVDNTTAPFHTRMNKGHEAMAYHQYFYDFYDVLPDISILIHAHERSWHTDTLLSRSMVSSLNNLDMAEVQRRKFLNLRITWGDGCSNALNTTLTSKATLGIPEQRAMQDSFRANFNIYDIPEILASPCCSQIAVIKELVQLVPRAQYNHHIEWLMKTDLDDTISGRVWEHMWHYLFLRKAIDCPVEHLAYCRLYHICFGGKNAYDEWVGLNKGREKLERELKKLGELDKGGIGNTTVKNKPMPKLDATKKAREKTKKILKDELASLKLVIKVQREAAIVRGLLEMNREAEGIVETVNITTTMKKPENIT